MLPCCSQSGAPTLTSPANNAVYTDSCAFCAAVSVSGCCCLLAACLSGHLTCSEVVLKEVLGCSHVLQQHASQLPPLLWRYRTSWLQAACCVCRPRRDLLPQAGQAVNQTGSQGLTIAGSVVVNDCALRTAAQLGCCAAWSLPVSVRRCVFVACCYVVQLSEVHAGSMQGSSGEGPCVFTHYPLVHSPQAALGLPLQHGLGLCKERTGQGAPPLLGRKACYRLLLGLPTRVRAAAQIYTGKPRSSDVSCLQVWGSVVRARTCRAASVGLRHLITPCRPDSGEASVTQGHCMAQRWPVRAPAAKARHGHQSAGLKK